jgi:AcrR family transcriptional regulator
LTGQSAKEPPLSRAADPLAKSALLRAAELVFADKGLERAKVEEITQRAGMSKGAFYLHFTSKEEAFRQVLDAFFARCSALIAPPDAFDELPKDPDEMLAATLDHDVSTFEFLWQNRAMLRIIDGCQGAHRFLLDAFLESTQNNARDWLKRMQDAGLCRREVDLSIASALLCGGYRALTMRMLAQDKKPPLREWLADAQRVFLGGLATGRLRDAFATARKSRARRAGHDMEKVDR